MNRKMSFNRVVMLIILVFTVISCDLKKAEEAFEKGDYVTAVEYSVKYLDGKKKFPNNKESKKILENLQYIVNYYEGNIGNNNDIDSRIKNLTEFREIRVLLNNKLYDKEIRFFTGKYSINDLGMRLAEQYYIKGDNIKIVKTDDYLKKAELYEKGASYYLYNDIKQKGADNRFKYSDLKASEYYSAGLKAEKSGNFRSAANNFLEAIKVYKAYGSYKEADRLYNLNLEKADKIEAEKYYQSGRTSERSSSYCDAAESYSKAISIYEKHGVYKDSKDLYNKNNELCKRGIAEKHYNEAKRLENNARYKYEFRNVAQKYYDAYVAYKDLGTYKDSYQLYKTYEDRGKIRVYITNDIDNVVRSGINKPYVVFTSSYSNADIVVDIREDRRYREHPDQYNRRDISERHKTGVRDIQDAQGRRSKEDVYENFSFKEVKRYQKNELIMNMEFIVSGLVRYSNRYRYVEESYRDEIYYEGRVPGGYDKKHSGEYRNEKDMYKRIKDKMFDDLQYNEVRRLRDSLERL